MPKDVADLLASWKGQEGRCRNDTISKAIPHCLIWCIWRERNARNFECERFILELELLNTIGVDVGDRSISF